MDKVFKQKIALALSTGAARGIAHIGAIEELERLGYEISSIAGCSMGALVGGAYATGNLHKCEEYLCALDNRKVLDMVDLTVLKEGFVKGEKIMRRLGEIVPDVNIEDLPVPYAAVATNLPDEREIVFEHGSLHDAIRASISVPLFFVPFKKDGMVLIDGAASNPLPLSRVKRHEGDLLVAVVACNAPKDIRHTRSVRFNKFSLLTEALTAMVQRLIRYSISECRPDMVIYIPTRDYSLLDLKNAPELIEAGRIAVRNAINEYQKCGTQLAGPDSGL